MEEKVKMGKKIKIDERVKNLKDWEEIVKIYSPAQMELFILLDKMRSENYNEKEIKLIDNLLDYFIINNI